MLTEGRKLEDRLLRTSCTALKIEKRVLDIFILMFYIMYCGLISFFPSRSLKTLRANEYNE